MHVEKFITHKRKHLSARLKPAVVVGRHCATATAAELPPFSFGSSFKARRFVYVIEFLGRGLCTAGHIPGNGICTARLKYLKCNLGVVHYFKVFHVLNYKID